MVVNVPATRNDVLTHDKYGVGERITVNAGGTVSHPWEATSVTWQWNWNRNEQTSLPGLPGSAVAGGR
jgi:hypothetical protein